MSKINRKSSLALAVMAACMLSAPAAFAVTVTDGASPSTLPSVVANLDVKDATTVVSLGQVDINISNTDLIIGRTTGFSVRIDLAGGATFGAAVPASPVAVNGALDNNGASTAWTASVAAGGAAGDTFVVYSVQPAATSTGVINGPALAFAPGDLQLKAVAGLKTAGASVSATVTFADPNTAQQILTPVTQQVIASANPLKFSIAASADPNEKINVSSANAASKTAFAQNGDLTDPAFYTFDAGKLTFGTATVNDAAGAPFAWDPADAVAATVTGAFGAFVQAGATVDLVTNGSCAAPTASIAGTVAADKVTFSDTFANLGGGNTGILCFTLPNTNAKVIDATAVAVSATATRTATTGASSASGSAQAMAYNGPVAVVYTFNPAGNTTQQSFLRISNTGGTDGLVTITGRDDAGNAGAGAVSMTLAAGKSIQLTGDDLQNGNAAKGLTGALGAGTGKWILTVTGEISGMQVTNLNRNNNSGTVSNLGTPVSGAN